MFSCPEEPPCLALRRLIELCSVPEDPNLPPHKKFFPKSALTRLCTRQRVNETLKCRCTACHRQKDCIQRLCSIEGAVDLITGDHVPPDQEDAPLVLIFCLLVYIKGPQLIAFFLHKKNEFNDKVLEMRVTNFNESYVRLHVWPEFDSDEPLESGILAKEFRWNKYKFFLPYMKDDTYSEYDQSTILPFIDEKPIGRINDDGNFVQDQGAFGRVFSFNIEQEYHLFPQIKSATRYARKEIFSPTPMRFHAERKTLERIKKLEDPHLVRIIKSYKHGDVFNLVFPCARTNLGIYLRDKSFGATGESDGRIELNPLWRQLLGIANALDKIINYCPPQHLTGEVPLYGYHCDLKPANILVEDSGTLVISDFGQAKFKRIGGTSRITPLGGTEEYAPPEIDDSDPRYTRKYDIWSLGCIFLETCTFLVRGHDGLRLLDSTRSTKTAIHIEDDRFFAKMPGAMHYAVKPEVRQWIDELPGFCDSDQLASDFLGEFLSLVSQMLQVDISKRLTSREVCMILTGILNRYQPASFQSPPKHIEPLIFPPDNVEFGKDVLSKVQSMMYYADGDWKDGPIRIIEEPSHEVKALTVTGSKEIYLQLGARGQSKLIPRYASHSKYHQGYNDCHLYFSSSNSEKITFESTKFFFRDIRDAISVQSVLLSQDIRVSLRLSGFLFERLPPISRRLTTKLLSAEKKATTNRYKKATVQLWSEKSFRDPNTHSRQDSRNKARRQFFSEPLRRRILIYLESSILIVRIAKNVRIERRSSTSSSTILRIVPTDKTRDSSFVASLLPPVKHELVTGIPLSRELLDREEEKGVFECKLLELDFETVSQVKDFYASYKVLKGEWNAEDEEINRYKRNLGEVFGYGLD